MLVTTACGAKEDSNVTIIGGADGPTSIFLASKTSEGSEDTTTTETTDAIDTNASTTTTETTDANDSNASTTTTETTDITDTSESSVQPLFISGTWQTASIGYLDGEELQPEFYVQFTETEVNYGHMKDGTFTLDHSDSISEIEMTNHDHYKVKAESANGTQYTYQTAEGDADILEYYETWNEAGFPDTYRGGASLTLSK